ncbi:MAG: hypothetical protein RL442_30 [Pseudomonadota bacterium]|jgi:hypothetical protein
MEINLKLSLDEVNATLNLLGQMPTSSNVWPLCAKIRQQAEEQLPKKSMEQANVGDGQEAN